MSEFTGILKFLSDNFPWAIVIVLIVILIYFIINPEKIEKWSSIFARIFSFMSNKIEKHYISRDIQYKINSFGKEINKECQDLIPYKTEIRFINPTGFTKESCQHCEDKVIILMKDKHNQDENFVKAALISTENTLIPNSRNYVEPTLMKSIDLQFVKNLIFSENKNKLSFYIDNYFAPEIQENNILEGNIKVLEKLTEQGIFAKILLQELKDYGMVFYPNTPNNKIIKETKDFFENLRELAFKKHHEDVKLIFEGINIKVSFLLIGKTTKIFKPRGINISPYKQRIFTCEEIGINIVYILAWGINIVAARKLSDELDLMPDRFQKLSESSYKIKINKREKLDAICIRYRLLKNL